MSAPCPMYGFIVRAGDQDTGALRRRLVKRLAPIGWAVDEHREHSIVVTRDGSQATESDRQLVIDLLAGELDDPGATVSDLVDLNY